MDFHKEYPDGCWGERYCLSSKNWKRQRLLIIMETERMNFIRTNQNNASASQKQRGVLQIHPARHAVSETSERARQHYQTQESWPTALDDPLGPHQMNRIHLLHTLQAGRVAV